MRKLMTIAAVNGESDVPGWNAAIRDVMRAATHARVMRVIGIRSGLDGLGDSA